MDLRHDGDVDMCKVSLPGRRIESIFVDADEAHVVPGVLTDVADRREGVFGQ